MARLLRTAGLVAILGWAMTAPAATPAGPAAADRVVGLWLTEERDAHVRIERVGDRYQGAIVWLAEPEFPADDDQGMAGRPKVDRENPDPNARATPILGLVIVRGFRYQDGEWQGGTIYDPNNGKTYKCRMWFDGDVLRVRGFIGISLLGRSTSWTRVAGRGSEPER